MSTDSSDKLKVSKGTRCLLNFLHVVQLFLRQLWLTYTIIFLIMHLSGGSPLPSDLPLPIDQQQAIIQRMGLDQPLIWQYTLGLKNLFTLNWGYSFFNRFTPLTQLIRSALQSTALLASLALFLALPLAYTLALSAYFSPWQKLRKLLVLLIYLVGSLPSIISGPALFWWVSKYRPSSFSGGIYWQQMPWLAIVLLTISLPYASTFAKLLYNHLSFQMQWQAFDQLKAFGFCLTKRLWLIRSDLIAPTAKYIAIAFSQLLSGAVFIEETFKIEGLGRLSMQAIILRDYPTIMLTSLLFAVITLLLQAASDLLLQSLIPAKEDHRA